MAPPWVPNRRAGMPVLALRLDAREGYVLSRVDGATDMEQLAQVTGMPVAEVRGILERLVREGALEPPPSPPVPAGPPAPAANDPTGPADAATHRQLFETRLHPLLEDERAALAVVAEDPELSALCFDPVPAVIARVLENPRVGLSHARLIAANHRNPVGLDALALRVSFLGDREVQRLLLRNGQCPEPVLRRLLASRRLADLYALCQSHEVAERARASARGALRGRFATASPEDRVELIVTTEGRALVALAGQALDGRSVALLCARSLASPLLIQNLGQWPATPPTLISHLLKLPMARQSPTLRQLLRRHPNCPQAER